jgi:hypothetical protein
MEEDTSKLGVLKDQCHFEVLCHGRDSNSDDANFSQLGGGADFSLNVTDVTVTMTV